MAVLKDYPASELLVFIDDSLGSLSLAFTKGDGLRDSGLFLSELLNLFHRVITWCQNEDHWNVRLAVLEYLL